MTNSKFQIFSIFFLIAGLVSCGFEKRQCLISDLESPCPPNSHCTELSDHHDECNCRNGYIFNALYTNDQDYCFLDHTTILPAAISIPSSPPSTPHHHIIGGILIPLVLVAAFVGGAYVIVRHRVLQRIRDRVLGRRRRHRPTYHMGTEFDPPLI